MAQTAQKFMEDLLMSFSDAETAGRCFSAMEGLDYRDIDGIRDVLLEEQMLAPYAEEILQKYRNWLIREAPY